MMQKCLEDLLIGVRHFSPSAEAQFIGEPEGKRGQNSVGGEEEYGSFEAMDWDSHGVAL
jgi:hypothetical protein